MITILGKGPLTIKRTILGEAFEATFAHYRVLDVDFIVDTKNQGKRDSNGMRMDRYDGVYYKFTLELDDPPAAFGGTDGQNILTVLNLLGKLLTINHTNQFFRIIPAESDGARTEYACKLADKTIALRDVCSIKGAGQMIRLSLITMNLDTAFNVDHYEDQTTETAITDHEGNAITDHEGNSLTGI